ncbi:MAG: HNH endonuclease [Paludibacteraceae bacterium]|nr:HNH endonuclease [Paludibacteraceae bacterium]
MKNKENQTYEEYWSYTAAYTDYNSAPFIPVLKVCIDFIDKQNNSCYSTDKYKALQQQVCLITGITLPSVRKAINQLVKLGFLKPYLQGYVPEAKEYTIALTDKKRKSLLSKIVYNHCNFINSMTQTDDTGYGLIKFFLKTLEEVGVVDNKSLTALMTIDINKYPKGFLNQNELDEVFNRANRIGFMDRKYNQISHLKNLLSKLEDLQVHENAIYFKTDAIRLFGDDEETRKSVRDPYLQRVYKAELEDESTFVYNSEKPKCMLEGLSYPVLIASHIKPYKSSNPDEAFDVNNGLLLSKNTDSLFDLGYMTFNSDGTIIPSKVLSNDIVAYLSKFRLNKSFINPKRMKYMDYHRNHVFEKRFSVDKHRSYFIPEESSLMAAEPNASYNTTL